MRFLALLIAMFLTIGCCTAADAADPLNKPKTSWAQVPGGTVWLNPGDAYEHNTGLIRDRYGVKRYPTTPNTFKPPQVAPQPVYPAQPAYAPPVYAPQPIYQPQPVYQPQPIYSPQPYYQPAYPYAPAPWQIDTGRYAPQPQRPTSHAWGFGPYGDQVDPLDVPKTGDAPVIK